MKSFVQALKHLSTSPEYSRMKSCIYRWKWEKKSAAEAGRKDIDRDQMKEEIDDGPASFR